MRASSRRTMLKGAAALTALAAAPPGRAQGQAPVGPPVAKTGLVVEERFGLSMPDPYRWMEDAKDPDWEPYMRAQNAWARQSLAAIPGEPALVRRMAEVSGDLPTVQKVQRVAGKLFVEYRPMGAENFKLYEVDRPGGERRLLMDPEALRAADGAHVSMDFWVASPDGSHIAYGLSTAGSENSVVHVLRVADGKVLADALDRAQYAHPAWLADGSGFFLMRGRADAVVGEPDYYADRVAWLHRLGDDPARDVLVFSRVTHPTIVAAPFEFPVVKTAPGSDMALLLLAEGVRRQKRLYTAPVAEAMTGQAAWRLACDVADEVIDFDLRGRELYLLTEKDAPLGRLVRLDAAAPDFASARVVIAQGERPLEHIAAARDGVYIQVMDGGPERLKRMAPDGTLSDIAMPFAVGIYDMVSTQDEDGVDVRISGWLQPMAIWRAEPGGALVDTGLSPRPTFDLSRFETTRLYATARDGVKVPVDIVARKGTRRDGRAPCLLEAYGAYGISISPLFSPRFLPFLEAGGVMATACVRGGGEYGRPWWEAGRKATKFNTWRDAIASAEALIASGWCSPRTLTLLGTSAGGVMVGNAMIERPDLFAGAVDNVGVVNISRAEAEQNGPTNYDEFGDPHVEADFRNLYAMDAYLRVRDGARFPAVLIIAGMSDSRVAPWMGGKFAARLQKASASGAPVLLRVDFDAGHGFGSTRGQSDSLWADVYAFALWRAGAKGFQPTSEPEVIVPTCGGELAHSRLG